MTGPIGARGYCLGCGQERLARTLEDGYCGHGCSQAFLAGKSAGRAEAFAESAAEARRRSGEKMIDPICCVPELQCMAEWCEAQS